LAKLNEIVAEINTALQVIQLSDKRFQKGRFHGIAELMVTKDGDTNQTTPTIVTNNDQNNVRVSPDDTFPFILYHRMIGQTTVDNEENQWGYLIAREEENNMRMVILADRGILQINKEDLITGVNLGMPRELERAFLNANSLQSVEIEPGTWELDRNSVYDTEFNLAGNYLKPNQILIAYEYTIKTVTWTSCIQLCN